MSAFNGLKLVSAKRPQSATPIVQRRNKLSSLLDVNYLDRSASIILAGGSGE